jgi:hypothetical protein
MTNIPHLIFWQPPELKQTKLWNAYKSQDGSIYRANLTEEEVISLAAEAIEQGSYDQY